MEPINSRGAIPHSPRVPCLPAPRLIPSVWIGPGSDAGGMPCICGETEGLFFLIGNVAP